MRTNYCAAIKALCSGSLIVAQQTNALRCPGTPSGEPESLAFDATDELPLGLPAEADQTCFIVKAHRWDAEPLGYP